MDSCVNAFMQSLVKHTVPLKLRESRFLDDGMSPTPWNTLVLIATMRTTGTSSAGDLPARCARPGDRARGSAAHALMP